MSKNWKEEKARKDSRKRSRSQRDTRKAKRESKAFDFTVEPDDHRDNRD